MNESGCQAAWESQGWNPLSSTWSFHTPPKWPPGTCGSWGQSLQSFLPAHHPLHGLDCAGSSSSLLALSLLQFSHMRSIHTHTLSPLSYLGETAAWKQLAGRHWCRKFHLPILSHLRRVQPPAYLTNWVTLFWGWGEVADTKAPTIIISLQYCTMYTPIKQQQKWLTSIHSHLLIFLHC